MKRYIILILTLLTFLFASCSNLFESSVENISSETLASPVTRYVSISGNFEMDGAYPGSGRTAFPTIPGLTGLTFIVEAQNLTDSTSITNTITGGTSYNISVPVIAGLTKRYKIIVTAKQGTAEVLQGESQEFDISDESTVFSEAVRLHVLSGSGTKGGIALSVNIDSTVSISSASVTINGSTYDATNDGTRWDFTAAVDAIPTGAYPARFSFIGSSEEVFSFTQLVNIFSGLQTDSWTKNGSEQYLETDLSGDISCHITQSVIQSYEMTEIYVDASYTTTNPPEDGKTFSTGSGTFLNPLPTLDAAFSKLHDKDKDYTIYIRGRVPCFYTIPATIKTDGNGTQGNARSITICGAHNDNSIDILDGNREGRVLRINTSVPVTIKNLKITGGYLSGGYTGGAIFIFTGGTVKLGDGALITGNEVESETENQGFGGGVFLESGAKLFMYGTALITGNSAHYAGGGISNYGSVYLGYISETTKCELKNGYGVTGNHSGNMGGGIYNSGNLYIASGTISENDASATGGGAIYQIGDLYISGKTNIPYGVTNASNVKVYGAGKNDICIAKASSVYKKITVSGSLSKINKDAPVALTVDSMSTMTRGTKLVAADETNISDISAYEEAFIFTDPSTEWELFNTSDKKAIYANTPIYVAGTGTSRYVCGTSGNNTSGDGSKQRPYATISKAITLMTDETLPYVIKVDGTLTGKQEISSSLSLIPSGAYRAASVLIQGASTVKNADGSPRDCLDGKFTTQASGNTTLIISTTVPITFKHITIKGGKSSGTTDAGGIKISNQNCDVTLDEYTYVIDNETTRCGGGIYNQGKLIVKSGAKISGNTITETNTSEDGGSAIYISSTGIVNIEGGEISSNTCTSGRGAICIYSGKCFIYGDTEICNNKSENGYGGGIQISFGNLYLGYKSCNDDNSPKEFKEWTGKIDGNTSKLAGSAIHGTGNVYMSSGTISNNNTSAYDGAAISIYRGGSNKKFIMTGGTVKNNKTQNNPGPAIALEGIPLSLSGSAYIPCGADQKHCIELKRDDIDATINIAGKLEPPEECTGGIVAAVKPNTYDATANLSILTISDSPSPSTTLPAEVGKFALIPNPSAPTENWYISNEGFLKGPVHLTVDSTSSNSIIKDTVAANDETIITLSNDFTMGVSNGDAYTNQIEISAGKKVEIKASTPVTITVPYVGDLFKINGGTLILGENVTIQPVNSFHWSFATVYQGGSLIIQGATIQNVNLSGSWHGLIHCSGGATITMESGSIKNCNDTAIYVYDATFIMNGGEISGNAGDYESLGTGRVFAGGVTVQSGGKFIKTGGSIHDNHVSNIIYNKTYETADWYLEMEEPRPDYYSMYTPRNNVMFFAGAKYGTSLNSLTTYEQDTCFVDDF